MKGNRVPTHSAMNPTDPLDYRRVLSQPLRDLLESLGRKCPVTFEHSRRVAGRAHDLALAGHRLDRPQLLRTWLTGLLHDLGKLVVPTEVLAKEGDLDDQEWRWLRLSSLCTESLVRPLLPPGDPLAAALRATRERWNGGGYPDGLYAEQIPAEARIVHLADAIDAIENATPYREGQGLQAALRIVSECSRSQFDPYYVEIALSLWSDGSQAAADPFPGRNRERPPLAHTPGTVNW